jgi:adenylate cyclase
MTIRFKILALAFVILVVFGVVVGISTWLQHQFMNQIVAITRYHIPLRTLIADFDVRTDRYEMIILRLLRQPAFIQNEFEATKSQAQQEAKRIADDLSQFDALVDKALADPTIARKSASIFSELKGATPFIERQLDPFFKTGDQVLQAAANGRLDEAVTCRWNFARPKQPSARTPRLCAKSLPCLLQQSAARHCLAKALSKTLILSCLLWPVA